MFFFEIFIIIFFGLALGSFSTALIHRVPRKLSWLSGHSACPECKTKLGIVDLFPVISWCMFMGKCRHCSKKISWRYPLIELSSAFMCLVIYSVFGFNVESFLFMTTVPILLSLFVIDLRHMILPNQLIFILFVLGLLRLFYFSISDVFVKVSDMLIPYVLGAAIYAGVSWSLGFVLTKILKRNSLGLGDVKFFTVSGLWLGLYVLPYFMIASGGLAILFALFWRICVKKDVFPFGPALIFSFYSLLLFQGSFLH